MDPRPGRLLVVDDNEMNRDILSRRLARRGHVVDTAEDGQAALDMVGKQKYDLMLLDIMMPGIDGMEVLRRVRETQKPTDLPIIMVTAKSDSEDVVEALKAGANDYVLKPLDFPVVRARVSTQLHLKQAHDQLAKAHRRMKKNLDAAARVQQGQLPQEPFADRRATFAWAYRPCDELAGDGLSFMKLNDQQVAFYVIDVSGHGVAAALLSVSVAHRLSTAAGRSSILYSHDSDDPDAAADPANVVRRLNNRYPMEANGDHYFTMFYGVLNMDTGLVRYVSAGHPGPIIARAGGNVEKIETSAFPIGIVEDTAYETRELTIHAGDRLYIHSDGINEEFNEDREQFELHRTVQAIADTISVPLQESVDELIRRVAKWHGSNQMSDDLSVLAVELNK